MRNEDYLGYITDHLTTRELLEQLAEEAAELSQAALKLIRALGFNGNRTPVKPDAAWCSLDEEMEDTLVVYAAALGSWQALDERVAAAKRTRKLERWCSRLGIE